MSPEFVHKTVMTAEALDALKPRPGGRYADGTIGGAGHAEAILATSSPTGWLFGCDRDGDAVEAAKRGWRSLPGASKSGAEILRNWRTGFRREVVTECSLIWA